MRQSQTSGGFHHRKRFEGIVRAAHIALGAASSFLWYGHIDSVTEVGRSVTSDAAIMGLLSKVSVDGGHVWILIE